MHLPQAFSSHLSSVPDSTTHLKSKAPFSRFIFFLNHWRLSVSPCSFYLPLTSWGKKLHEEAIRAPQPSDLGRTYLWQNRKHGARTDAQSQRKISFWERWGSREGGSAPTQSIPQHCDKTRQRGSAACTLQNSTARLGPASTSPSPCHPKSSRARNSQRWSSSMHGQEESGPLESGWS